MYSLFPNNINENCEDIFINSGPLHTMMLQDWVVLVHDTRSNDARFMHKLCKHAFYIEINRDIKGSKKKLA